jgi:transcriptional regulator
MHIKSEFLIGDVEVARSLVRAHPFATLVSADLRATHMPCLVDDGAEGLTVLGHVARADPFCSALGAPILAVFHGPHGYVSASWYEDETIPTWNYVVVHLRGTAEVLPKSLPIVRQTVDHFESAVSQPWSLERMPDGGEKMAQQVVAFRLAADSWYAEAKLSQDKPEGEWARVVSGLEDGGSYGNPAVAAAMRRFRARKTVS